MFLWNNGTYLAVSKCYLRFAFCCIQIGWILVKLYLQLSDTTFIILEQKLGHLSSGACVFIRDGRWCGCELVGAWQFIYWYIWVQTHLYFLHLDKYRHHDWTAPTHPHHIKHSLTLSTIFKCFHIIQYLETSGFNIL